MTRSAAKARTLGIVSALLLLVGASAAAQERLAITSAIVVDVTNGSLLSGQTVLVEGNRITTVGPADEISVPEGATVVDGTGGYLIPGLWDMHTHSARAGRAPRFWPMFIAHGVTGVREMGSFTDSLLHWRAESERLASVAPRFHWSSPWELHIIPLPNAEAAAATMDSLQRLGFNFFKIGDEFSDRPPEEYFALAGEARQRGIPFVGHVPMAVTATEASDAGQKSFEHATELLFPCTPGATALARDHARVASRYGAASDSARTAQERLAGALAFGAPDVTECASLLERMVANGTWFTPTLTLYKGETQPSSFDGDTRLRWVPADVVERWRTNRRLTPELEAQVGGRIMANALSTVAIAHRHGVGMLAGTDVSDLPYIIAGSGLHDELALLVEAGLSPLDALRAATINPARFLERTHELGTVAAGMLADLVLLDANPLEDIENTRRIRAVVADGRLYRRIELDLLLAGVEALVERDHDPK